MDLIGNRTLCSVLRERVAQQPEKSFIRFEDRNGIYFEKSYGDFYQEVMRFSNALLKLGIKRGDHVVLHLPNNMEFFTAWFALAEIGGIMVPTNILSPADEMAYIIAHSEAVLIITEEDYIEKFVSIQSETPTIQNIIVTRQLDNVDGVLYFSNLIKDESDNNVHFPKVSAEDIVALLYTSGTTSKPKGVQVTHANYIYTGELMARSIALTPEDRTFIVLPLFHGNAQYYSTMSAIMVGAGIAVTEKFSASRYFKQAKALGGTVGSLFAAPIRMILAKDYEKEAQDNPLRLILFAQSVAEHQLIQFEEQFDVKLLQLYGLTETVGIPLINPLFGIRKNMSIGRPSIGYEVQLVDEYGNPVNQGEIGQIAVKGIRGRTIMKGYFKNEQATNDTFKDNWLLTGDNARIDEDGYFYFVDRIKDMIKRSGENVAANEVERVLTEHPLVFEAAVIGVPDDMRDEAIKVYVILQTGAAISEEALIAHCRERLAKFKVPDRIEFVPDFPRTPVGKIQKHVLRNAIYR
ncbi:crotonobetainyl-CoA:carnitine CoA-transferase [Lysinibacillus sphaericus]|uniref:AMP-binding protein n=1 Tax=Lysinibacillus sphaericus TaxID=1421 RepID=UPI0018CCAC69|nr:AMP-binding protein [Lysinibacillus sphaericus]MBG9453693.1 crotonobetainyl-CoA:carnitine CoA-transferase [Lysinibacillus sphaericus]MBG9476164.1 crotonobetainyl-CoA:carnitine CoA-transferase [Lysinibacillus sphaericus]MBG9591578.1 crotonobetainyl-CoA:carnitine CoA-transferase [Lysinibacillus sphaericus]